MRSAGYNHERINNPAPKKAATWPAVLIVLLVCVTSSIVLGGVALLSDPDLRRGLAVTMNRLFGMEGANGPKRLARSAPYEEESFQPTIDHSRLQWEQSRSFITLNTEVKNTSDVPLEYVRVEASFYDKDGVFLKSESPHIERWQRLAPGDRSPLTVMTPSDPRIKSVRLRFTCRGQRPFETVDVRATDMGKLR